MSRSTNGKMPIVSVIVPVCNAEQRLEACLESILSGAYQNIQLVAVDDGSADGSGEIMRRAAERDGRSECRPMPDSYGRADCEHLKAPKPTFGLN